MNFLHFLEETKSSIEDRMEEGTQVSITSIQKNNGIKKDGICILESGHNISPTIYLNDYYEKYLDGMEIEDVVREVLEVYKRSKVESGVDLDFFLDYEKAKKKLVYKLVNYEKNSNWLVGVPHLEYLDLAITFYCIVNNERFGSAVIQISNAHLNMWDVTLDNIYEAARQNTPLLLPYELLSMEQVLGSMLGEGCEEMPDLSEQEVSMYVLSNTSRVNGAATILYPDILKDFAKACGRDLYILPSSVHEVILVPDTGIGNPETFQEMIQDVNATQLSPEEVLSDHVYIFKRKKNEIISG